MMKSLAGKWRLWWRLSKCGEEMDLFTPRFIVESWCQTVLTGSCCLKSLLGKNTCHANKLTENHLNIQELSSETFASEQEPLNCIFTTQWSRVTWCVQVSVCVHFVVFRKWSMNVVGVCSCGNWSCWGGAGADFGTGMNWRALVRPIWGQGPLLHPQTKSLFW